MNESLTTKMRRTQLNEAYQRGGHCPFFSKSDFSISFLAQAQNQVSPSSSASPAASAASATPPAATQAASQTPYDRIEWVPTQSLFLNSFPSWCLIVSGESGKTSILRAMIMTQVKTKERETQTKNVLEYDTWDKGKESVRLDLKMQFLAPLAVLLE